MRERKGEDGRRRERERESESESERATGSPDPPTRACRQTDLEKLGR